MTGAVLLAFALVTVLVLGPYLVHAAVAAVGVATSLTVAAGHVAVTLICAAVWLGWLLVHPREAWASLRDGIARAEAESAIRRLNA